MVRVQVITTVDRACLDEARRKTSVTDSVLFDLALGALLARHRSAEVDATYAAYDAAPLDEPDAWGDLAAFRAEAAAS